MKLLFLVLKMGLGGGEGRDYKTKKLEKYKNTIKKLKMLIFSQHRGWKVNNISEVNNLFLVFYSLNNSLRAGKNGKT